MTTLQEQAMQTALNRIQLAFGNGAIVAKHKSMARTAIRALSGKLWPMSFVSYLDRYSPLTNELSSDLDHAISHTSCLLAREQSYMGQHGAQWLLKPSRNRLAMLSEALIILRWMRRRKLHTQFATAIEELAF